MLEKRSASSQDEIQTLFREFISFRIWKNNVIEFQSFIAIVFFLNPITSTWNFSKTEILHHEIKSDFYQIKMNPYKIIRNYSSNPRYRNRKYNENESNKYVQCKITFWLQSLGKSCTRKNFTWNNAFLRARDSKGCIKCGKGVF